MNRTVFAIRHVPFEDLGSLAPVLIERGFEIRYLEAGLDDLSTLDPGAQDVLVIGSRARARVPVPEDLRRVYLDLGIDLYRHNGDDSWELPIPATIVVDPARRVQLAFVDVDHTKRLEPDRILEALDVLRGRG